MAKEHLRERILSGTVEDAIQRRTGEGWQIVAIEWERDISNGITSEDRQREPVPFGLRIADDCRHLESDPLELEILAFVTEMIVRERPLPAISEALNQRGFQTRDGQPWTPATVFELMPRIVDSGPRIFAAPNWRERRTNAQP
jgi:hypothetical protein